MPTQSGVDHKPVRLCDEIMAWIERAADKGFLGNDHSSIIESRGEVGRAVSAEGNGGREEEGALLSCSAPGRRGATRQRRNPARELAHALEYFRYELHQLAHISELIMVCEWLILRSTWGTFSKQIETDHSRSASGSGSWFLSSLCCVYVFEVTRAPHAVVKS